MPLTTARPWKDKTGLLHLRQRTPRDLIRLMGTVVSLPLGTWTRTVRIGEVVQMSLRTRSIPEAKRLHATADAALKRFWEAHREGRDPDRSFPAEAPQLLQPPPGPTPSRSPASTEGILTTAILLERWLAHHADKKAKNTLKRYRVSLRSLSAYLGERDARSLTGDDLHAWAEHRRDRDGVSARAVNKNDLVAASSMFRWAMDRSGGRVLTSNPASGVRLDEPRRVERRERTFRPNEVKAILRASLAVEAHPRDPSISDAERWCPWLAAYSGARIGELCYLTGEDIRVEDGVPIMHLLATKTGEARKVPLHADLVERGFLRFAATKGSSPLFYDPARHRDGVQTHPAEIRAQQLAIWVREAAGLTDRDVAPSHGWRHSWKTIALGAGIEERIRDAITGHKVASVGRRYEAPPVSMLAAAMSRFPRYELT